MKVQDAPGAFGSAVDAPDEAPPAGNAMRAQLRADGVGSLYEGAAGATLATVLGHYPWFLTNNFLEKRFKTDANPALSYDDTVQLALACLQNVLGSDLKAPDIEACVVRSDNLKFTRLTEDELETQLNSLAERDDDLVGKGD